MHRVHHLEIELGVGGEAVAHAVAERVRAMHASRLAPCLARVLEGAGTGATLRRIDRLEVNLGRIPADALEQELERRLEEALRAALVDALRRTAGEPPARASLEALETYALTGTLPWWADPEDREVVACQFRAAVATAPGALLAVVRRLGPDPGTVERLARACDGDALAQLAAGADPDARPARSEPRAGGFAARRELLLRLAAGPGHADERGAHVAGAAATREAWGGRAGASEPVSGDELRVDTPRVSRDVHDRREGGEGATRSAGAEWPPARMLPMVAGAPERPPAKARTPGALEHERRGSTSPSLNTGPPGLAGPSANVRRGSPPVAPGPPIEPCGAPTSGDAPSAVGDWATVPPPPLAEACPPTPLAPALATSLAGAPEPVAAPSLASFAGPVAPVAAPPPSLAGPHAPVAVPRARFAPLPAPLRAARRAALARLDAIHVGDAGLVILWPFLERFFARNGLVAVDGGLANPAAAVEATALLHSLATGEPEPLEAQVPLAKVLCGLSPEDDFPIEGPLAPEQLAEGELLLAAVVDHARVLGECSVDRLRASFLQRPGALSTADGTWLLQVERRTEDVVLDRFPWSWAWVRLPWMRSALRVEW